MPFKRKAVATSSAAALKHLKGPRGKALKELPVTEEAEEKPEEEPEVEEEQKEDEEEKGEEAEEESAEEALARQEEETKAARRKELKGLYSGELKELVSSKGLELGNKATMVEAVVAHEAAQRAAEREHAARMRAAVTSKKEELESMPMPQLRALCQEKDITGTMTKQARVEQLLKLWQEDDGVPKALAQMARDARESELAAMDKLTLRSLCEEAGVNPFVKEVMVDRIIKCEVDVGRFKRATAQADEMEKAAEGSDIVEAMLSNEAARKKEKERKKQQEEAMAAKRKELRAMSNEQLKKLLSSKGLDAGGKKDEMVEALYASHVKEELVVARKAVLKSLPLDELKKSAASKGLAKVTKKDELVESLLAHEEHLRKEEEAYESMLQEVLQKKREDLEEKTNSELKELCAEKDLKLGVAKEERVERLLEHARVSGEMEEVIAGRKCAARREALLAMEVPDLETLAGDLGTDTLVKEVMVERLLSHETGAAAAGGSSGGGAAAAAVASEAEPAAKKSRKKK